MSIHCLGVIQNMCGLNASSGFIIHPERKNSATFSCHSISCLVMPALQKATGLLYASILWEVSRMRKRL